MYGEETVCEGKVVVQSEFSDSEVLENFFFFNV